MASEAEYEERHRFLRGPGGKQLLLAMGKSIAAIHFGTRDERNHGTMFFIRTSSGLFGVTARHVYEEYCERVGKQQTGCQIDNLTFAPTQRLLSVGKECDIATFRITEDEFAEIGKNTVPWPPLMPKVGNAVLIAGFPKPERKISAPCDIEFGVYMAQATVSSLSDNQISILIPPDEQFIDTLGNGFPPRNYDMGGMSGGPLATIVDSHGILSWRVCGVIHESHQDFEILQAVRADFIDDNGMVTA